MAKPDYAAAAFDADIRDRWMADLKSHPLRAWWILVLPLIVPVAFSLLILFARNSPEPLLAISGVVEPLLIVFNGEALRNDLTYIGDNEPYAGLVLVANLLWTLASFAMAYLVILRGGLFPIDIACRLEKKNEPCRDFRELLATFYSKIYSRWFEIWLYLSCALMIYVISGGLPGYTNILDDFKDFHFVLSFSIFAECYLISVILMAGYDHRYVMSSALGYKFRTRTAEMNRDG